MGKYFGTDGFRGEAGRELNVEHAYNIGRFLGYYYGKEHKCTAVIGKDTRRSSYMFENALSAGLTASGADVYLLHVTTTASVAYVTKTENFDCGIMISASHNPYYDNGIKIMNSRGEKLGDGIIGRIEEYLDGGAARVPFATGKAIGRTVDHSAGRNRYMGYLLSLATRSFQDIKVGLDCANGSAWMIAKNVFDALGARTYIINNEPDGTNINVDCGSTHIEALSSFVTENKLDVGFAFDGDADRCIAVDDKGSVVNGDGILYVCGTYMKKMGALPKDSVVTTVMSNLGLYKALDEAGIGYVQVPVGDRFVFEKMLEGGYGLGGEQSGHIIFSKYATTGDGILTSIKLMEACIESKQPLSKLSGPMKEYPQCLKNVSVKDKQAVICDPDVLRAVDSISQRLGSDGRILVRPSGTEPLVRVMAEAATDEICESCVDEVADIIKKKWNAGNSAGT